jgi:hypothetical protein
MKIFTLLFRKLTFKVQALLFMFLVDQKQTSFFLLFILVRGPGRAQHASIVKIKNISLIYLGTALTRQRYEL